MSVRSLAEAEAGMSAWEGSLLRSQLASVLLSLSAQSPRLTRLLGLEWTVARSDLLLRWDG